MGRFIAQRTVKLMINNGIQLKGARVGILGVTFKENVYDTRNSRVPDIAHELAEFGIDVVLHDPLADPESVRHEYQLELQELHNLGELQGLILAVAHRELLDMGSEALTSLVTSGGVFVDVKSALAPDQIPEYLSYWSL
jgi:UDP-N-acetyl-D-galactosamine dehydrogenase